jgi:hypothetical protein
MKTMRTTEAILTDIKRIQRKRAHNWITPERCASLAHEMLHARQLDDLKHELKALENSQDHSPKVG